MYTDGQTEFLPGPLDVCFDVAKIYPPLISIIFIWKIEKIEVRLKGNCCLLTFTGSSLAEERSGGTGCPHKPSDEICTISPQHKLPAEKSSSETAGEKAVGGFVGGGGRSGMRRWWVGSDPAPAPTDSPTEAADMQATAVAAVLFLAGETISRETDEGFTACQALKPYQACCWPYLVGRRIPG